MRTRLVSQLRAEGSLFLEELGGKSGTSSGQEDDS